jgi:hypothetical protein
MSSSSPRSPRSPRKCSPLKIKQDDSKYSFFQRKVDPILAPCVAKMLTLQPMNIDEAMRIYLLGLQQNATTGIAESANVTHAVESLPSLDPKVPPKVFFSTYMGPVVSKIVASVGSFQPDDVVSHLINLFSTGEI